MTESVFRDPEFQRVNDLLAKEREEPRKIKSRAMDSFPIKRKHWLWATNTDEKRTPAYGLSLCIGHGGVGKSTLTCTQAAWISKGDMKGEFFGTPKDVLIVAHEDDVSEDIKPRLHAAGADMTRIHVLTIEEIGAEEEDSVLLPTDCRIIEKEIKRLRDAGHDVVALIVDPLSGSLNVDNTNDGKKVRRAASAVHKMALRAKIAVIGVVHTRKMASTNLMLSLLGSVELGNVARAAFGLVPDEEVPGTVVLSQEKINNSSLEIPGYRYKINGCTLCIDQWGNPVEHDDPSVHEFVETQRLEFVEKVEPQKASDILKEQIMGGVVSKSALAEAKQFLRHYLTDKSGRAPRGECIRAGKLDGHSQPTLERAARILKLVSVPSGRGAARDWMLPGEAITSESP